MPETITPERIEAVAEKLLTIGHECVRAINTQSGCPFIVIRGHFPAKGWPRGKCCGSDSKGRFYWYDAKKVLAKIVSLGIMTVEYKLRGQNEEAHPETDAPNLEPKNQRTPVQGV